MQGATKPRGNGNCRCGVIRGAVVNGVK